MYIENQSLMKLNGGREIRKIIIAMVTLCVIAALLASTAEAQIPEIKEADIDVTLQLTLEGRLNFNASLTAQSELAKVPEAPPITAADATITISSPAFGQLKINASGSMRFTDEKALEVGMVLAIFGIDKDWINEGSPPYWPGLKTFEGKYLSE